MPNRTRVSRITGPSAKLSREEENLSVDVPKVFKASKETSVRPHISRGAENREPRGDKVIRSKRARPPVPAQPDLRPTVPQEFHFRSDSRLRLSHSKDEAAVRPKEVNSSVHPVPDFRAIHAAEEARKATVKSSLKTLVLPSLGAPSNASARAKEREKFEEKLRIKEQELAALKAEAGKKRLAEEEAWLKEERKRTIPRANEVPKWYQDAPRKQKKAT
ncbi:hypothetical protein SISSUDRAFT_1057356 [Sistotremastrum suecicum HHB10207 ss-3]|uniref:TPX2 C-terminal domain-containing protein n=1 Tax=Sistotremastrum suecicum HHB10207 ss-3 TaxID=1314776 RepID=A0A166IK12_9AGAM|nr:hypothetical protein SISSUDRAFT_1057356 [Sistotremastrum suecicum HHB10207 ss-3]